MIQKITESTFDYHKRRLKKADGKEEKKIIVITRDDMTENRKRISHHLNHRTHTHKTPNQKWKFYFINRLN